MKLNRLALTIVHFDAEDVIATSGGGVPVGAFSLSTNSYSALRSEAEEAKLNYSADIQSAPFVYFQYDAGTQSFSDSFDNWACTEMADNDHYAWYSNGQWWTENKPCGDYGYDRTSTDNWRTE